MVHSQQIWEQNLHPAEMTQYVAYINHFFDTFRCLPPEKLPKFFVKRYGNRLYLNIKLQGLGPKTDSCCAAYCLCLINLTNLRGKSITCSIKLH